METFNIHEKMASLGMFRPSYRFKGGGGGHDPNYNWTTTNAKWAQSQLYPILEELLATRGASNGEGTIEANQRLLTTSLENANTQARKELAIDLDRGVQGGDSRVKLAAMDMFDKGAVSSEDSLMRAFKQEDTIRYDQAMSDAFGALSAEKRMAISGTQAYNQSLNNSYNNLMNAGTFGTNLAMQAGEGVAMMHYANLMSEGS